MADDLSPSGEAATASKTTTQNAEGDTAAAERTGRRRRRSSYASRDLTKGSVRKNLWFLAWPQVAEGALSVVDQLADVFWAGRIGFHAIAAIAPAQTYMMMTMTFRMGLDAGLRSMISRAIGARDTARANHVFLQALTLTTLYVAVVLAVGILLAEPALGLLGLADDVMNQAVRYMQIQFVAIGMLSYHRLTASALQAAGDSMTPLKAATVTRIVHLVLSPILIFGWLGLPSFGLAGAALARVSAEWIGVAFNSYALFRGTSRLDINLKAWRIDLPLIWQLVKIGLPAAVTNVQRAFSQLAMLAIVAPFGTGALAAFTVTRRAENLVNQGSRGLGRAAGALAGQNLGAGLPDRARSAVQWAIVYVAGGSIAITALVMLFPEEMASWFNSDPEFISVAARWMFIAALGYFSMSAVQVFTQSFNNSGSTFIPMIITLATVWVIDIPIAFVLSQYTSLGEFGVAWAIVIGMTARLLGFIWFYFRGAWLRVGVV
jgi:putative MATE family efflux protein